MSNKAYSGNLIATVSPATKTLIKMAAVHNHLTIGEVIEILALRNLSEDLTIDNPSNPVNQVA